MGLMSFNVDILKYIDMSILHRQEMNKEGKILLFEIILNLSATILLSM